MDEEVASRGTAGGNMNEEMEDSLDRVYQVAMLYPADPKTGRRDKLEAVEPVKLSICSATALEYLLLIESVRFVIAVPARLPLEL